MKVTKFLPLILFFFVFSCIEEESLSIPQAQEPESFAKSVSLRAETDFEVFFAQTHVLRPSDPYFGLVSDRPALIKAHLTSESGEAAPEVTATLTLNGETTTLDLVGPTILPPYADLSPGKVVHSFDDSFTKLIPKEWIQPGLEVTIQAGDQQVYFGNLLIGAPNRIPMTMIDAHFFSEGTGDHPDGWQEDMNAKLPTAGLDFRRVPVVFPEISVAPQNGKRPAARVSSPEHYIEVTGLDFDNEQNTASMWNRALHLAGGMVPERSFFITNMYNIPTNGQGSPFSSVNNINKPGVFFHEFGHALNLWHWANRKWIGEYPYYGDMHGIKAPTDTGNRVHAGPTWKFDLKKGEFISPFIKNGTELRYKKDPMAGGGQADLAPGHIFSHYSDYSADRARRFLEQKAAVWNEELGIYARWNQSDGAYTNTVRHNNGVDFPREANTEVISIMASGSIVTKTANLIYEPIGPYTGGIIDLFDAEDAHDRAEANRLFCKKGRCDVSLRVTQGGATTTYIFPMILNTTAAEKSTSGFGTRAINLRESDGDVTKVEMLYTPFVEERGLPTDPEVLDVWEKE